MSPASAKRKAPPKDAQLETLEDLEGAVHYNRWIAGMMEPHVGERVLEIGCGTGNMTAFLLEQARRVLAVDIHPAYLAAARRRFGRNPRVSFRRLDLERGLAPLRSFRPDTIVCVNVLEHVFDDVGLLAECRRILVPGGRLLLFVPAFQWLYGSMDETYGHFRRYTKSGLRAKLEKTGLEVSQCRYLNLLGIFGWWLNGRLLRRRTIPRAQMLAYDRVVRFVMPVERWLPKPIGLSLFVVAVRSAAASERRKVEKASAR